MNAVHLSQTTPNVDFSLFRKKDVDEPRGSFAELFGVDSSARSLLRNQRQTDASQMFEAAGNDPGSARREAIKREYGQPESRVEESDGASESVAPPQSTAAQPPAPANADHGTNTGGADIQPVQTTIDHPDDAQRISIQATSPVVDRPLADERASEPGAQNDRQSVQTSRVDVQATAPAAAVEAPTAAPQSPTLAQKVGEVLRVGDTSSTNRVAIPRGESNVNGSNESRRSDSPPTTRRASTSQPRANAKPESAGRSSFDELVQSLRARISDRRSSARIRLEPPELGHIRVDVKLNGDQVRVDVQTDNPGARDLVSRRVEWLKQGLAQHGIHLDHIDVVLNNTEVVNEVPVDPYPAESVSTARRPGRATVGERRDEPVRREIDSGKKSGVRHARAGSARLDVRA